MTAEQNMSATVAGFRPAVYGTATIIIFVLAASTAVADGGFVSPLDSEIWEPSQIAFIDYDADQSMEHLHILPEFSGDAREFAWIVPVPALPEIAAPHHEFFRELRNLTSPVYRHRDDNWACGENTFSPDAAGVGGEQGVEVIDDRVVGIYRTMTISADNSVALIDSLTEWGFVHSQNVETLEPLIQAYVDDGWYFVAMTVDSMSFSELYPEYQSYFNGQMHPISLSFASAEIIYPMRISALSSRYQTPVYIYVLADHRMTAPGMDTFYANRITDDELTAIRRSYPAVGRELEVGDFLTKLYRRFSVEDMDEDVLIEPAGHDREYRPINYSGFPLFNLLLIASVLLWGTRKIRRRPKRVLLK